jgi:5'-deoxynucleotidase YfbR-like HD superfamily hydrolase
MEPEIEGRFDRIESLLGEVEKRFKSRLGESEERLSEQLRDMQTELLKAFLPWQEQIRIQFRELEANTGNSVTATKQRMDVMERRLGEIEKRLLMNPPAA